ncbi:Vitamin B12 ABC transporter, permease protein BtuC [hydrothermal vent metagenome]|uniref:Vitamin B12 ABC transporter, permease protein BtuC n=1 Tax=hydrothermal vent metagenome TaxID=652676 RepID=A0A3B0RD89_9ZZZZ
MSQRFTINLIFCFAIAVLLCLSVLSGKVWINPFAANIEARDLWIITELRLPRSLLAVVIGMALGLSGAVLQGFLRNPLADPAIVGISSSAAFGAVLAIFLGLSQSGWSVFIAAMLGAAAAMALLGLLSGRSASPVAFILAGMVLSSLTGSLTAFLISIAPNPFATSEIVNWLMGALTDRGYDDLMISLPFIALGSVILASTGKALNLLSLGEETARTMGLNMTILLWTIIAGLGLSVGASVAVTGVVGFVGLIVPHLVRPFVGQKPSDVMLPSALAGAILLLLADILVRLTPGAGEVRLGIAMALIGTPFFFYILFKLRGRLSWG